MLSTEVFQTRSAKVILAVACVLLLAAFQVAVEAKPAHAYEVHISIMGAGQVTETTSANLVGSGCVTSATNPTGVVGKDCYPGDPNGPYSYGWDVTYVATAKPGYRFVQWQSDGSPKPIICDYSTPPATSSTYTGSTCKFKTFDNLQTRAVFVDDTNPTMVNLSGPTGPVNGTATFTFSASSDPTLRFFECRVAGVHDWQTCSSGKTENPPTGTYTFEVRAVDWSNNRSSALSWTWTVDKTPPDVTLDPTSGPQSGSTVESNSGEFRFSSTDTQATFECRRYLSSASNPPAFSACTSPYSFAGLNDGRYTFEVRSVDRAGNRSAIASRQWTISNAPRVDSGTLSPTKGATGVARNTNVSATFTEAMYPDSLRDPFTGISKTFKLQMYNKKTGKWKAIPGTVVLSNSNKTATFNPYGDATTLLGANKKFKATITTGAKDASGNPMASNFMWTFKTGSSQA